jgi:hypothetical protein
MPANGRLTRWRSCRAGGRGIDTRIVLELVDQREDILHGTRRVTDRIQSAPNLAASIDHQREALQPTAAGGAEGRKP